MSLNSLYSFSALDLTTGLFFTSVPVQRNCAYWGGEAPFVQRGGNYSYAHASHKGKWWFAFEALSSVMSATGFKCPLSWTGRGADVEEDQEENPQQKVGSGEPQEEEGLCWWTGEQVRKRGWRSTVKRSSFHQINKNSGKYFFYSWD